MDNKTLLQTIGENNDKEVKEFLDKKYGFLLVYKMENGSIYRRFFRNLYDFKGLYPFYNTLSPFIVFARYYYNSTDISEFRTLKI